MLWLALALVLVVMLGNALILLRTARKPKIPESFKPRPDDEDGGGW